PSSASTRATRSFHWASVGKPSSPLSPFGPWAALAAPAASIRFSSAAVIGVPPASPSAHLSGSKAIVSYLLGSTPSRGRSPVPARRSRVFRVHRVQRADIQEGARVITIDHIRLESLHSDLISDGVGMHPHNVTNLSDLTLRDIDAFQVVAVLNVNHPRLTRKLTLVLSNSDIVAVNINVVRPVYTLQHISVARLHEHETERVVIGSLKDSDSRTAERFLLVNIAGNRLGNPILTEIPEINERRIQSGLGVSRTIGAERGHPHSAGGTRHCAKNVGRVRHDETPSRACCDRTRLTPYPLNQ